MSRKRFSPWYIGGASLILAAVGYRLRPGYVLPPPVVPRVVPLKRVVVPITPYVGTSRWHELGQSSAKLRQRMGIPLFTETGNGIVSAYPGSYALVETGEQKSSNRKNWDTVCGLDFNFNLLKRKANILPVLALTVDGKPIRLTFQMTPAQLAAQLDCDVSRPGSLFRDNDSWERARSKTSDACRLVKPAQIRGGQCSYYILKTGIRCDFGEGHLYSVYMSPPSGDPSAWLE